MFSLDNNRPLIISELSPQNDGCISDLKTMILQSKMGGADFVKIQIYNSLDLLKSKKKEFAEINKDELNDIKNFCDNMGVKLLASVFDHEKLDWIKELNFEYIKVASKVHANNKELLKSIVNSGARVFISNGLEPDSFEYADMENVNYFYCVANYPTLLEDLKLPCFKTSKFTGFSDHTFGISAAKVAISTGASFVEKHFTISKSQQSSVNKGHYGSMTFEELLDLKRFVNDFAKIGKVYKTK